MTSGRWSIISPRILARDRPHKGEQIAELPSAQESLPQSSGHEASLIAAAEGVTAGVTFDRLLKANQEPWELVDFRRNLPKYSQQPSESDHA